MNENKEIIKEDIRIQKTRRDLRKAIFDLITVEQFEKITVIDICKKALVNRMTFYKYYEDKYQLLDDALQAIKDELLENFDLSKDIDNIEDAITKCTKLTEKVIETCIDNKTILLALKNNSSNVEFSNVIVKVCEDSISCIFEELNKIQPLKYPIPILTSFTFGGIANSLDYWLRHQNCITKAEFKRSMNDLRSAIINSEIIIK